VKLSRLIPNGLVLFLFPLHDFFPPYAFHVTVSYLSSAGLGDRLHMLSVLGTEIFPSTLVNEPPSFLLLPVQLPPLDTTVLNLRSYLCYFFQQVRPRRYGRMESISSIYQTTSLPPPPRSILPATLPKKQKFFSSLVICYVYPFPLLGTAGRD